MARRAHRPARTLTVALGAQQMLVDKRLASGSYSSASDVLRAGLRALEREEAALDEALGRMAREALADSRPPIPMDEVFARLRARHGLRAKR